MSWTVIEHGMIYISDDFTYRPNIIITDMERCLVRSTTKNKIFSSMGEYTVQLINMKFHEIISSIKEKTALVILTNQQRSSHTYLRTRVESMAKVLNYPFMFIASMNNNRLCKPHIGMYILINAIYKKHKVAIDRVLVVSAHGGFVKSKKDIDIYDSSDVDRIFANNCNLPFCGINEFCGITQDAKFVYNHACTALEDRAKHIGAINSRPVVNLLTHIEELPVKNSYIIVLIGPPSCGKTTLANKLLEDWKKSPLYEQNGIFYNTYITKTNIKMYLRRGASLIIDNGYHIKNKRDKLEEIVSEFSAHLIYIIIDIDIHLSKLFSHIAVEETKILTQTFYTHSDYIKYYEYFSYPSKYTLYSPKITISTKLLNMQF